MTIASCPRCHEQVSLPLAAPPNAAVRCPLCREEYSLQEALASVPPQLILLDAPASAPDPYMPPSAAAFHRPADSSQVGDPAAVSDASDDEMAVVEVEDDGPPSVAPAFQLDAATQAGGPSTTGVRVRSAPRKQKSAAKEVFKVAAGGMVGLLIGQAILWWGLQKDPFRIAPKVGQYAAFLVPASLRGGPVAQSEDTPEDEPPVENLPPINVANDGAFAFGDDEPSASASPKGKRKKEKAAATPPQTTADESNGSPDASSLAPVQPFATTEPSPEPPSDELEIPDISMPDLSAIVNPAEPSGAESSEDPPTSETTETATAEELVRIQGLPSLTPTDLVDRLAEAKTASQQWGEADRNDTTEMRTRAANLYRALARLGEVLSVVDQADPQVREARDEVQDLLVALSGDDEQADLVKKVAPNWMSARRPHDGVILLGKVISITSQGKLFETEIEIAPRQNVTIVSARDPQQTMQLEGDVVLLGLIVDQPMERIDAYFGTASKVVLDGFHVGLESR